MLIIVNLQFVICFFYSFSFFFNFFSFFLPTLFLVICTPTHWKVIGNPKIVSYFTYIYKHIND